MPKPVTKEIEEPEKKEEDEVSFSSVIMKSLDEQDHLNEDDEDEYPDTAPALKTTIPDDDEDNLSSVLHHLTTEKPDKGEKVEKEEGGAEDGNIEDAEGVINKDGTKPSIKTSDFIRSLKEENSLLKTQLEEANKSLVKDDEYQKVIAERDKLKGLIDTIHFEHSDSFKGKFVKPLNDGIAKAIKIIEALVPKDNIQEATKPWSEALAALGSGNEAMFLARINEVSDFIENRVGQTKFETAMAKVWEMQEEKQSATESMNETRERLMLEELDKSSQDAQISARRLDALFQQFEDSNKGILDLYRSSDKHKELFRYDEVSGAAIPAAKKELETFLRTKQMSESLGQMIIQGALHEVHLNERKSLISALRALNEKVEEKDGIINELKDKVKATVPNSRSGQSRTKSKTDDENEDVRLSTALREHLA